MINIIYTGFGELIDGLKAVFTNDALEQVSFTDVADSASFAESDLFGQAELFLVGPFSREAVKQASKAYQKNKLLSVIIMPFPEQLSKTKMALQFSHKVGATISCFAFNASNSLVPVLQNAVNKTRQRLSFRRIQVKAQAAALPSLQVKGGQLDALANLLELVPMGGLICDKYQKVVSANSAFKKLMGNEFLKEKGTRLSDLLPLNSMPGNKTVDSQLLDIDGKFLQLKAAPFADGEQDYNMLLVDNVTEKIMTERSLKDKIDLLEIANEDMEQFINIVSHDFRTPITSIGLLCDLLLKGGVNEEKKLEFISRIKQSSDNLKDLLQGLVVLIDAQQVQAEKVEELEFETELLFIMDQYREMLEDINVEIEYDFSESAKIRYLEAHLKSLLSNVLGNAIKYRDAERPLKVSFKTRKEKNFIVLNVKDNGIGIDLKKNLDKLFHPFKRFTSQASGSGLGLSLIKRMIERNGGYIQLHSMPGEGTELVIFLREYS